MTFNLTDKRVECLRYLAARTVPVYVCAIAHSVFPRAAYIHGREGPSYWPQQATRAGAGYVRPMCEAGLVLVYWAEHGWGTVEISPEGRRVLTAFERQVTPEAMGLELAAAAHAFTKRGRNGCPWFETWRRRA